MGMLFVCLIDLFCTTLTKEIMIQIIALKLKHSLSLNSCTFENPLAKLHVCLLTKPVMRFDRLMLISSDQHKTLKRSNCTIV